MGKLFSQCRYFVALGATGLMVSLPAFAGVNPSPVMQSKEVTEAPADPAVQGNEPAPVDDPSVTPAPATTFTPEEIEQFATVIPELQTIQESAQANVMTVVETSGLSAERFNQIAQAQTSPEATGQVEISSEEQAAFETAIAEIQQIEQGFLAQRDELLQSQGLTVERYQAILAAVQQDPALLQQVEEML